MSEKWAVGAMGCRNNDLTPLNPTKAIGPDKISPHFLKEVHDEISPMISDLFQSSVNTGTVPNDWREAIVTPVFKKGAKSKPENYRPISLACILSKVLEHNCFLHNEPSRQS